MSKCEKQVVTKLNKKLEKYGLTREELELKLHSASLYGKSVFEISKTDAESLIALIHENYCSNHDVATGNYDCPYATTVLNTICCTGHECNHKGIYENTVVNNLYEDEDDECLSCPYFNPEAPDCCTYAPEACYYDTEPDKYPF